MARESVIKGDLKAVKELVEKGVPVEKVLNYAEQFQQGKIIKHFKKASYNQKEETMSFAPKRALAEYGISAEEEAALDDYQGYFAAGNYKHALRIAERYPQWFSKPQPFCFEGKYPLHTLAYATPKEYKREQKIWKRFIELGCSYYSHDEIEGYTVLSASLSVDNMEGKVTCWRELISDGVDPIFPNADGGTALHIASRTCNLDAVEFLLSCGLEKSSRNKNGATALDVVGKQFNTMGRDPDTLEYINKIKDLLI